MKQPEIALAATVAVLLAACASTTPAGTDAGAGADSASAAAANEVAGSDTPLGPIVYDEEARRDCRRKARRTGTRIPRGVCESGLYGEAIHVPEGGASEDTVTANPN